MDRSCPDNREHVGTDHEVPVRVDARPEPMSASTNPGSDGPDPRAGRVRVAGEGVLNEDRVRSLGVEFAPRFEPTVTSEMTGAFADAGAFEASALNRANFRSPGSSPIRQVPGNEPRVTPLGRGERAIEVGEDVLNRLDTDRESHHVRSHASAQLLVLAHCECVVEAGWMARLRTSPTFAR